jgi:hypothetical protein
MSKFTIPYFAKKQSIQPPLTMDEDSVKEGIDKLEDEDQKLELKTIMKKWVESDNEIREMTQLLKEKRQLNREYSGQLMKVIKRMDIQMVDLNNGHVSYVEKNQKQSITKYFLLDVFTKYFNGNRVEAQKLHNFIDENRQIITKPVLVRKIASK